MPLTSWNGLGSTRVNRVILSYAIAPIISVVSKALTLKFNAVSVIELDHRMIRMSTSISSGHAPVAWKKSLKADLRT